jgi:hypothetical protein
MHHLLEVELCVVEHDVVDRVWHERQGRGTDGVLADEGT